MKCNAKNLNGNKCGNNVKSGATMEVEGKIFFLCTKHFNMFTAFPSKMAFAVEGVDVQVPQHLAFHAFAGLEGLLNQANTTMASEPENKEKTEMNTSIITIRTRFEDINTISLKYSDKMGYFYVVNGDTKHLTPKTTIKFPKGMNEDFYSTFLSTHRTTRAMEAKLKEIVLAHPEWSIMFPMKDAVVVAEIETVCGQDHFDKMMENLAGSDMEYGEGELIIDPTQPCSICAAKYPNNKETAMTKTRTFMWIHTEFFGEDTGRTVMARAQAAIEQFIIEDSMHLYSTHALDMLGSVYGEVDMDFSFELKHIGIDDSDVVKELLDHNVRVKDGGFVEASMAKVDHNTFSEYMRALWNARNAAAMSLSDLYDTVDADFATTTNTPTEENTMNTQNPEEAMNAKQFIHENQGEEMCTACDGSGESRFNIPCEFCGGNGVARIQEDEDNGMKDFMHNITEAQADGYNVQDLDLIGLNDWLNEAANTNYTSQALYIRSNASISARDNGKPGFIYNGSEYMGVIIIDDCDMFFVVADRANKDWNTCPVKELNDFMITNNKENTMEPSAGDVSYTLTADQVKWITPYVNMIKLTNHVNKMMKSALSARNTIIEDAGAVMNGDVFMGFIAYVDKKFMFAGTTDTDLIPMSEFKVVAKKPYVPQAKTQNKTVVVASNMPSRDFDTRIEAINFAKGLGKTSTLSGNAKGGWTVTYKG